NRVRRPTETRQCGAPDIPAPPRAAHLPERHLGRIGLWSIIMTLFLRLDPGQAEQFTEHLTTGAGLHRGHPLLMLRNRLLGSQRDQYSTLSGREALVAIAIKAWNAWRDGRSLPSLSWRAEGRKAE